MVYRDNIRALSQLCVSNFHELSRILANSPAEADPDMSLRTIDNLSGRFRIWCGNLGALQWGGSSLDTRLRDSVIMRVTVLKFLEQLQEALKQSVEITAGARRPWEDQQYQRLAPMDYQKQESSTLEDENSDGDSDTSDENNSGELAERQSEIQDTITHLYRLSFKIRNAERRSLSTKALSMKHADPETGVDLFSVYANHDRQHVLETLKQLREFPGLLTVGMSPARSTEDENFGFLLERLSRATTNRRRYFEYWKRHALKPSRIVKEALNRTPFEKKKREGLSTLHATYPRNQDMLEGESIGDPGPETLMSGTEIFGSRHILDDYVDSQTIISYASTARDVDGKSAILPPPPTEASIKSEFVCPYCWVACPAWQGIGKAWRMHILRDLQPYICTYPHCSDGNLLYSTREAWMEHERMCHRRVWRCFDQQHMDVLYKSKEQLHCHLSDRHTDLTELQIENLLELVEITIADDRQVCPFCLVTAPFIEGLYKHMAVHQERLAVFSAPRLVNEYSDEETGSGGARGVSSARSLYSTSSHSLDGIQASVKGSRKELSTALRQASEIGDAELVKLLLDKGADVNALHGSCSALQAASSNGHEKVVKLLLDRGANVNASGGDYGSALQAASLHNHAPIVGLLLDRGAELMPEDGRVLHSAVADVDFEDRWFSNLILMCRLQGRWEAAVELGQQVLQRATKHLGSEYPTTLASMANLVSVYKDQGHFTAAEKLEKQLLEIKKKKLGSDHPDTLASMANLARTYRAQGKWKKAEDLKAKKRERSIPHAPSQMQSTKATLPMHFFTSALYEHAAKTGKQLQYMKTRASPNVWRCEAIFNSVRGVGKAPRFRDAKHIASQKICDALRIT